MELVTPDIGLLFWMLFSFCIVLIILRKFAWKPILSALKEREEGFQTALNSAEEARKEIAETKEEASEMNIPKYMEWYGAFGLMVTLIWLYLEILRLLAKLQSRD